MAMKPVRYVWEKEKGKKGVLAIALWTRLGLMMLIAIGLFIEGLKSEKTTFKFSIPQIFVRKIFWS